MLFVGQTRFSLFNPKSSSWRATGGRFKSEADYEAYLYAPERLNKRCELFIKQSLPQIAQAARDYPIMHVVSYSSNLPAAYRDQLEAAAEKYSFVHLDEHDGERTPTDVHDLARQHFGSTGQVNPYGTYRLDDDDLLASDYFDQMSAYIRQDLAGTQVTLSRGLTALYSEGRFINLRETYWPMLAIGLLSVCAIMPDDEVVKPVHAPHNLSDRYNPVITDARKLSYLWVRHAEQDTALDFVSASAESAVLASMSRYAAAPADASFKELFPHAAAYVAPRVEQLLASPAEVSDPKALAFSEPVRTFDLSIDAEYGADAVDINGLLSFDIRAENGQPIDGAVLRSAGLAESTNPAIGFYRYLQTQPGRSETRYPVSLPAGVRCHAVTVARFKKLDTAVTLHGVTAAITQ